MRLLNILTKMAAYITNGCYTDKTNAKTNDYIGVPIEGPKRSHYRY